jgi:hypothetical protein
MKKKNWYSGPDGKIGEKKDTHFFGSVFQVMLSGMLCCHLYKNKRTTCEKYCKFL